MKPPQSIEEFMIVALAIEREAVQRYTELADTMETHNNREVAQLFRTMAGYEAKHAQQIKAQMGWTEDPPLPHIAWPKVPGPHFEGPETAPFEDVHYLMQPWHALQLALAAEQRAQQFFAELAQAAGSEPVRAAARELEQEEREHVALVQAWIARLPKPERDWANDPDPPRFID